MLTTLLPSKALPRCNSVVSVSSPPKRPFPIFPSQRHGQCRPASTAARTIPSTTTRTASSLAASGVGKLVEGAIDDGCGGGFSDSSFLARRTPPAAVVAVVVELVSVTVGIRSPRGRRLMAAAESGATATRGK